MDVCDHESVGQRRSERCARIGVLLFPARLARGDFLTPFALLLFLLLRYTSMSRVCVEVPARSAFRMPLVAIATSATLLREIVIFDIDDFSSR